MYTEKQESVIANVREAMKTIVDGKLFKNNQELTDKHTVNFVDKDFNISVTSDVSYSKDGFINLMRSVKDVLRIPEDYLSRYIKYDLFVKMKDTAYINLEVEIDMAKYHTDLANGVRDMDNYELISMLPDGESVQPVFEAIGRYMGGFFSTTEGSIKVSYKLPPVQTVKFDMYIKEK